ncbi:hypothetical protein [Paraburkholderia tropica]|nr:hypothetical protein [Paraburkholderia tropica]
MRALAERIQRRGGRRVGNQVDQFRFAVGQHDVERRRLGAHAAKV